MTGNIKDHPYVGVDIIIINNQNEILLEKRALSMSAYKGYWCLPGGWMDGEESVEDALKREAQEELGVEIEVIKFVGRYYNTQGLPIKKKARISLPHLCKIVSGEPTANQPEEVDEIKWVKLDEAIKLELAYDHHQMIVDLINFNKSDF